MSDIDAIAARHGVSPEAARHLLGALAQGHGTAAQFNHPELGGMGQWTAGGMIMIGDMFNAGLKARVAALCADLAPLASTAAAAAPGWWPAELGHPAALGAQNDLRYAYFPETRRLAVESGGRLSVYDTGDHRIGGASQQQGSGYGLHFTSQHGMVRLQDLPQVGGGGAPVVEVASADPPPAPAPAPAAPVAPVSAAPVSAAPAPAASTPAEPASAPAPLAAGTAVLDLLERLAELHRKGVLTDAEFATKKSELLARL